MTLKSAEAYIPIDRREAVATGGVLPDHSTGAVLFVDISGFTPLTNALRRHYGARRGAEELTRHLNHVYTALITEIERYRGSVIGFSGDAITCWFAVTAENAEHRQLALQRAVTAALAIQQAMDTWQSIQLGQQPPVHLAVKTAVAAGMVRRFVVGDPQIQLIDVLAGSTLDRMAATEQMAQQGELVLDGESVAQVADSLTIREWRTNSASGHQYAVVEALTPVAEPAAWPTHPPLADAEVRSWVLPAIAPRLEGGQDRFLAELRPAAALFLKFTGLDYDHDEAAAQNLHEYISWVQQVIHRYGGALIQLTTGDKGSYLYATFGAPVAHDDDIERAVAVALLLRASPDRYPFIEQVQIGISYGTMRVGAYGSESRRTYGVLGNETNMAARFMTHAKPGQIVVGQVVADAIAGQYTVEPLGDVLLKGRTTPQPLFAVTGQQMRVARSHSLSATALIGREQELALLQTQVARLQQRRGGLLRIVGSAGIGKSHIVAAFVQSIGQSGTPLRVVYGSGQSTAQDTAYFALRQIMQDLLAIGQESILNAKRLDQLTETLTARNPNWTLRLPLLGDLLGIPIPENSTTAAFDARLRQEALVTLTAEIISHYAQEQPLVMVLEDAHWLDEASQGIVLALARAAHTTPLLLLLVHRPPAREEEKFLHEVTALPEQMAIVLNELDPAGINVLVETRLGGPISDLAASLIQVQAQGNPFFTEELVDALQESAQLQLVDGQWTLAESFIQQLRNAGCLTGRIGKERVNPTAVLSEIDIGIPTTIQGIVLSRLDRLPEPVKLTVKVAGVIGRIFAQDLLSQAHPRRPHADELAQEIETLLAREFARVEAPAPHPSYIFKHNITQEVVYQTLLTDQRHELHLAVAAALETLQPESVEALAMHYYNSNLAEARVQEKAVHYLELAGLRAQRDYANETALSYFNRALGLEQRADWLKAKVEILHILGRREEEQATLAQFAVVGDVDPGEVGLLWGSYYEALSEYDAAQQHVGQALTYYRENQDSRGEVQCLSQLGVISGRQADYDAAQAHYQEALKISQTDDGLHNERASLLYGLSIVNRQQGNYQDAGSQLESALALYRNTGNRQGEARILTALGVIAHIQRDYATAEIRYQQALSIQQVIGDRTGESSSLMSLGQAARSRGDYSKAAEIIKDSLEIFQSLNNRWWAAIGHNELGIIAMMTGEFQVANQHFNRSLVISRAIGDMTGEAVALLNLGQTIREQGDFERAEELLLQSKKYAEQHGNKYFVAQCWSDLAICSLYSHEPKQAIDRAGQALTTFEELGVTSALTTELNTLAEAYLLLDDYTQAENYARQTFQLLEELQAEGPDYPHRDYFTCYRIFHRVQQTDIAYAALTKSYMILRDKAAKISDEQTRTSFLENVAVHRQILAVAVQNGLLKAEYKSS